MIVLVIEVIKLNATLVKKKTKNNKKNNNKLLSKLQKHDNNTRDVHVASW